jgi:mevalonate kinase
VLVQAPDVGLEAELGELPETHPLAQAILITLKAFELDRMPACTVRISSTIPVAAGLGSGAAVSVALIRATAAFLGQRLPVERVSALAYEVDKLYHGTPSGIDNTAIAFGLPVYFIRGQPIELLKLPVPFTIVIGDTGIQSPTAIAVGDLRQLWQEDPGRYEALFDAVGVIAQAARRSIESGKPDELGPLMNENQDLLGKMGISCPELDRLVTAALSAGALGAKLSGGGRGGNMIALVRSEAAASVAQALERNGAIRTISTSVRLPAQ